MGIYLKSGYYIRYADDFLFLARDKSYLENLLPQIEKFLTEKLCLSLHPNKVSITTLASGIDFLGWVNFPNHAVLRTTTKRRMLKNITPEINDASLASYTGMLRHGNAYGLRQEIERKRSQS